MRRTIEGEREPCLDDQVKKTALGGIGTTRKTGLQHSKTGFFL